MILIDVLPQAAPLVVSVLGILAAVTLLSIPVALHADSLDSAERADLYRLTVPLPERSGRHRVGVAPGSSAQQARWTAPTRALDLAELHRELVAG